MNFIDSKKRGQANLKRNIKLLDKEKNELMAVAEKKDEILDMPAESQKQIEEIKQKMEVLKEKEFTPPPYIPN